MGKARCSTFSPTGNLDSANGAHILDVLRGLSAERGTIVVMATHSEAAFTLEIELPQDLSRADLIFVMESVQ